MARIDRLGAGLKDRLGALAARVAAGDLSPAAFRQQMARQLITAQAAAYMLGRGTDKLTLADQRKITDANKQQLSFLDRFVSEIASGTYDEREQGLVARAQLYAGSVRQTYEQGKTAGVDLPAYPGDGSTDCLSNCRCAWVEQSGAWYWQRGVDDSCETCVTREREWAPYANG